jgi:hypothetical protein
LDVLRALASSVVAFVVVVVLVDFVASSRHRVVARRENASTRASRSSTRTSGISAALMMAFSFVAVIARASGSAIVTRSVDARRPGSRGRLTDSDDDFAVDARACVRYNDDEEW